MTIRKIVAAALISGALCIPAMAKTHHNGCEKKVRKAEASLNQAIRKHGERSRQAEQKREVLERVRATCHR